MRNERRRWLKALAGLPLMAVLPAGAGDLEAFRQRGRLRVAVYNDFLPFSNAGKGIDVDLARAIAGKLGLTAEIVGFNADEDMNDDLRNMVWKGHYLGTQPADLMMHVPVDVHLAKANDKVRIFGAYHRESLGVARDAARIQPLTGSAAMALEVFTREKIGVETATLADSFLLSVLNGRLRENVVHFKNVAEAAQALQRGAVAAVLAPRSELEAAMVGQSKIPVEPANLSELKVGGWPLGMAVKVEENELADALVAALAELKREGVVAEIFKRHGITYQAA
ncbi:MAG: transporter substrate-binding domain-containing protein [Rhodocyclaceae bacterium]|nr:transporter substrate-binding domain-containing protein [Rhodocyclaceae bacterium]